MGLRGYKIGNLDVSISSHSNNFARWNRYWMAPEVIACDPDSASSVGASYDTKSDIWSVGVTAIEMAEKNPPLAEIHPMRALHMIPTADINFAKPKNFTANFRDFVNQCLTRDPRRRPTAEQMLQHPFLAKAITIGPEKRKIVLAELVQKYRKDRQRAREGYRGPVEEDDVDPFAQFDQPAAPPPPPPGPTPEQLAAAEAARKAQDEAVAAKAAALAASITAAAQAQEAIASAQQSVGIAIQPLPTPAVPVTAATETRIVEQEKQALLLAQQQQLKQNGIVSPVPAPVVLTPEQQLQAQVGGAPGAAGGAMATIPAPLPAPLPAPMPVPSPAPPKPAGPIPGGIGVCGQASFFICGSNAISLQPKSVVGPAQFQQASPAAAKALDAFAIGGLIDHDVLTGDFIGPYLLLGTENNLYFVDTTQPVDRQVPIKLISDVRFQQIMVLEDYDVMLALSGRHRWVRQYRLKSLKKLILHYAQQTYGKSSDGPATARSTGDSRTTTVIHGSLVVQGSSDDEYRRAQMGGDTQLEDTPAKIARWTGDFIKLPRTKQSRKFVVERTTNSAHLLVLLGQDLVLYEWAVEPYLRFMQVKAFWLPELPKYMSLVNDGFYIRDIWLGYQKEANLIRVEDAQVSELTVPTELLNTAQRSGSKKSPRWESWVQIPYDDTIKTKLATFGRSNSTINKKIRAAIAPTAGGKGIGDVPVLLLGTYGNVTRVIDLEGRIVDTSATGYGNAANHGYAITWSGVPKEVLLRPGSYVIGIMNDTIEVASWRTGEVIQTLRAPDGTPLQLLTYRDGKLYVLTGKKSSGYRVYMLQDSKLSTNVNVGSTRVAAPPV